MAVACLIVAVLLIPCDSTAVELGYATWIVLVALGAMTAAVVYWPLGPLQGRTIELLLLVLVSWIGIAAISVVGAGNLRQAVNEFWIWVALLAVLITTRRTLCGLASQRCMLVVLLAMIGCLAIHAIHQNQISIPETIARYLEDPERELRNAGVEAPKGSAIRFQYEGRMFAAESSASFSLSTSASILLLLGFVILFHAVLDWKMLGMTRAQQMVVAVTAITVLGALFTTGSKIALGIAGLFTISAVGWKLAGQGRAGRLFRQMTGRRAAAMVVVFVLFVPTFGAWIASRPSILASFPRALQFRFQYWSSTFAMLGEHPWFGSGPGNFQSAYPKYKPASISEMIADPHNFLLESATCGGWIGMLLCLAIVGTIAASWWEDRLGSGRHGNEEDESGSLDFPIVIGAMLATVTVWVVGSLFGVAPDLEPYLISLPLAAIFVAVFWRWKPPLSHVHRLMRMGCASAGLAMIVSGGLTVPGIVIPIWCLIGTSSTSVVEVASGSRPMRALSLNLGLILCVAFGTTTLLPISRAAALANMATGRFAMGDFTGGIGLIEQAAAADRWDPSYAKQFGGALTQMMMGRQVPQLRASWQHWLGEIIERDPRNPRAWQQRGDSLASVFQRWRRAEDLSAAIESYQRALELDPTSIAMHAQFAVMLEAAGRKSESERSWQRAKAISDVNDNTESKWNLLFILPAESDGSQSALPQRITVEQAWKNR